MFMIHLQLVNGKDEIVSQQSRSTMIRYKSPLHRIVHIVFFSLPLLMGWMDESEVIMIPVLENFYDDSSNPVAKLGIQLSSTDIQVYSASVFIEARLSSFRSFIYHWFLTSAFMGVSLIF